MMPMTGKQLADRVAGRTLVDLIADNVADRCEAIALRWKDGGSWSELSWSGYARQAGQVASGLRALGVGHGDRVAMLLRNRPECNITDIGAVLRGATTTSLYMTSSTEQLRWLLNDFETDVLVVDGPSELERVLSIRDQLPGLRTLVCVDDPGGIGDSSVLRWSDLLADPPVGLSEAARTVRPDDIATVIYTSGTTGAPKAAQHNHAGILASLECVHLAFGADFVRKRVISYLPMAHVGERISSHYQALRNGYEVTFCPEVLAAGDYLREVRPQIFFGPPRIWEKLWSAAQQIASATPDPDGADLRRAIAVGLDMVRARQIPGSAVSAELEAAWQEVAPARGRLTSMLGLDQVEIGVTSAAAMPTDVLDGIGALGVALSDFYGMTEFIGWVGDPYQPRRGTAGRPFPGVEVRISPDGEVEMYGPQAFAGYAKDPERTAAMFTADGWLRTGDLGSLDQDGYLTLVGRKKDLIITAGGKNIAPEPLENAIASHPLVAAAVVVGEARRYPAALIILDPMALAERAKALGTGETDPARLIADPDVTAEVQRHVDEINARFSRPERVKRVKILPVIWGTDADVLTPTMKIKRDVFTEKYAAEIESLYT